eukprot:3737274-Amphidinium_carterae.5
MRTTRNQTTQTEPERLLVTRYGACYHHDPGCHGLNASTTVSEYRAWSVRTPMFNSGGVQKNHACYVTGSPSSAI